MSMGALSELSALAFFALLPAFCAWRFVVFYYPRPRHANTRKELAKAAVILAVRGLDPSLPACLTSLLRQTYGHYTLHVMVDNLDDPARRIIEEIVRQVRSTVRVEIRILSCRRRECSLKLSAQLEAIRYLEPDTEAIAFVDADCEPGPTWLEDLIAPLADSRIGAVSGIRWYMPQLGSFGSWVRYLFNALAVFQMYNFSIPWGGSFAVSRHILAELSLLTEWARSFGEDTSAYRPLRRLNKRIAFSPRATALCKEPISLRATYDFIFRQLLSLRLHHPYWAVIFLMNFASLLAVLICLYLMAFAGFRGLPRVDLVVLVCVYLVSQLIPLIAVDSSMTARHGLSLIVASTWMLLPAIVATAGMTLIAEFASIFARRVTWRGATYDIIGSSQIRLSKDGALSNSYRDGASL